jgi:hypothetical protein
MLDLAPVRVVGDALSRAGTLFALGGSGLLCSLGLSEEVRDLDFTTDAPLCEVEQALTSFDWHRAVHGDPPFASQYRLTVETTGPQIDLMGLFAIEAEDGICRLPTIQCGVWNGLPVGSPEVWAVAYRLMKRHAKADLLSEYLRNHSTHKEVVAYLLRQPLPSHLRVEIASWL